MSRHHRLDEILGAADLNGLYRLPAGMTVPGATCLAGKALTSKSMMLEVVAKALAFPDYFGANWDALEECLADLSWRDGAIVLVIEDAVAPEENAPAEWGVLLDILVHAARQWQKEGRPFAVFLQGGHAAYSMVAA
jgi:RNAse (barnase) inhibitor barstar